MDGIERYTPPSDLAFMQREGVARSCQATFLLNFANSFSTDAVGFGPRTCCSTAGANGAHTPSFAPADFFLTTPPGRESSARQSGRAVTLDAPNFDNTLLIGRAGADDLRVGSALSSAPAAQTRAAGPAYWSIVMPAPFARLLGSSRFWTAAGALAITIASVIGLDPDKATKVVSAVVALAAAVIASTSYEDAASDSSPVTVPPTAASTIPKLLLMLLLPALLLAGGCQYAQTPAQADRTAEAATYDAVAPEHRVYIHSDPNLSADQVARRDRTLDTWAIRVGRAVSTQPATAPSN